MRSPPAPSTATARDLGLCQLALSLLAASSKCDAPRRASARPHPHPYFSPLIPCRRVQQLLPYELHTTVCAQLRAMPATASCVDALAKLHACPPASTPPLHLYGVGE
mmetsp:Transcript_22482/g.68531  ORF Transcript_22482/g.68531 Transcript_22482/m.68531 type:complete len:107 (-) Transcript_22482:1413-1733(-)